MTLRCISLLRGRPFTSIQSRAYDVMTWICSGYLSKRRPIETIRSAPNSAALIARSSPAASLRLMRQSRTGMDINKPRTIHPIYFLDSCVLFVTTSNADDWTYQWIAKDVGFRVYVADWRDIFVNADKIFLVAGCEVISSGRNRAVHFERVEPDVIFHRTMFANGSADLLAELARAAPLSLISFNRYVQRFTGKWTSEIQFRAQDDTDGITRPQTYLCTKEEALERLRETRGEPEMIIKPAFESKCYGVEIATPKSFGLVAQRMRRSQSTRVVMQHLVLDPVLYEGKKFDLRIYALITSFQPLQFRVYREGVARVAARRYNPENLDDPLVSLTGTSFRRRKGFPPEDISITEVLDHLKKEGYQVGDFWNSVDELLGKVFRSLAAYCVPRDNLDRCFLLTGADLLMQRQGDSFRIVFLEMNYVPGITEWGEPLDSVLQPTHRQWLADLLVLSRRSRKERPPRNGPIGATGSASTPEQDSASRFSITNAHEHFQSIDCVPKFLEAMRRNDVVKTVIVGSPEATIISGRAGFFGEEKYNLEALRIATAYPDSFIAFPTLNPRDPKKLENLERWLALGGKGLKLYSGHSSFYDLPLNHPTMIPVYRFCEDNNIPILFHVNVALYQREFEKVLAKFSGLKTICPHLCLSTSAPDRFDHLMRRYPNLYSDVSMGYIDFMKAAILRLSRNAKKFRELIVDHQDRIFFGTDNVITDAPHKTVDWIDKMTRVYRDILERKEYSFFGIGGRSLTGLHLDKEVLEKIFRLNFEKFLAK
jgi:predicted TIM-barrel fold metal-dependent hydrolase